jgi:hypothetical protein
LLEDGGGLRQTETPGTVAGMDSAYRDGARDLGPLRSVHVDRSNYVLWALAGLLGACIVGWALFSGISTSLASLMALVVVAGIGALWLIGRRNPGARIELHESGLVVRAGQAVRAIPFDDVRSVTSSSMRRRTFGVQRQRHVVEPRDGSPFEFSLLYGRAPALLEAIHAGTRERLRAEALRAYDAGDVVHFGPLAVCEDGFRDGNAPVVPWTQLERATFEMRDFAFGETWSQVKVWKKRATAPLASYASERVPNAMVLLDVVALAVDAADEGD